jgi:hypothetical protein
MIAVVVYNLDKQKVIGMFLLSIHILRHRHIVRIRNVHSHMVLDIAVDMVL